MMKTYELCEMPEIIFAHTYETEKYSTSFVASDSWIEITYVFAGEMTFIKENEIFKVKAGDIICQMHDEKVTVKVDDFHRHHTVGISAKWILADKNCGLYLPFVTKSCKETKEITMLIDKLIFESYKYEKSPSKAAGRILGILCKIDEISRKNIKAKQPEASILAEKAKKYIQKNLHKPITQTEVANSLEISSGYLCRIFRKSEGTSLMNYINTTKLKNMQMLMQKENLKLYEAAELYGYRDPNYVSALYKKLFGYNITSIKNADNLK